MAIAVFSLAEHARPSNCVTDLVLCVMHLGFVVIFFKLTPAARQAQHMRMLAVSYATLCSLWQAQGAWNHLFDPIPAELSFSYAMYVMLGAGCPCMYGCAISLDMMPTRTARCYTAFGVSWLVYAILALMQVDFADYLTLPRTQELTLSVSVTNWLPAHLLPWLPRVQAASGGAGHPITLLWDGRGYAAVPFEHAFDSDRMYADKFELISPHPCWKVHSFPFLFLIFGLGLNTIFLVMSLFAYLGAATQDVSRSRRRFFTRLVAHFITQIGIVLMPVAMLFSGVGGGINWMHLVLVPAMYMQCRGLEDAILSNMDGARKSQ